MTHVSGSFDEPRDQTCTRSEPRAVIPAESSDRSPETILFASSSLYKIDNKMINNSQFANATSGAVAAFSILDSTRGCILARACNRKINSTKHIPVSFPAFRPRKRDSYISYGTGSRSIVGRDAAGIELWHPHHLSLGHKLTST